MFPYDSTLLNAVQADPQSIPEVIRTFEAIDAICVDGDGLKWFNRIYLEVTRAVAAQTAAGEFNDPVWIATLDVQFARLYLAALRCSLGGQTASACWRVLLERRSQSKTARIQFALAGINAHINHDLAEAIVATCQATGTQPDHCATYYSDYNAINGTLDGLIGAAKQTLEVRLLGDALPPMSHLEDTIAAWSVGAARESAWQNAEHLWSIRTTPVLVTSFLEMLDGFTSVIGKALLVPVP